MSILGLVYYFEPWWVQILKALVIFGVVLSLNYLGDIVRARTDVRESTL